MSMSDWERPDPAAMDLSTGHVIARVEERHRSQEFIALLKDLDGY